MERVVPLFFRKILNEESITVYGENKVLDFTYIDDCIEGIFMGIKKLLNKEIKNQTFNLAYGSGNHLVTIVKEFEKFLQKTAIVNYEASRLGEVVHYVADLGKAKKYLNYSPKTSLHDGLSKAANWYARTLS